MEPATPGKKMHPAKIAMIAMVMALVVVPGYNMLVPSHAAAPSADTSPAANSSPTASPSPGPVVGDISKEGRVNAVDLSALVSHDGQDYPAADLNGDGTVGAADQAILLSKWTW